MKTETMLIIGAVAVGAYFMLKPAAPAPTSSGTGVTFGQDADGAWSGGVSLGFVDDLFS